MKKSVFRFFIINFLAFTGYASYSQCASPQGNQTSYGNNYWIGYAYQAQNNFAAGNYYGYFNELDVFDESFCGQDCNFAINGCAIRTQQFSVRFKMTKAFACGDYTFTIGADDGVRLSIDGGSTYLINNIYSDHGYTTSAVTTTLAEGNYNLVLDYYEAGGDNRVSFTYAPANGNTKGPGVIGSSQFFCQAAPFDPAAFTSTSAASFCAGSAPTYQWQESTDQWTWTNIGGATSITYDAPAYATLGIRYFRRAANNGTYTIYSNTLSVTTATPPGDPAVYGNGVWNAYVFNSTTAGTNYWGYYTENILSFNTQTRWANNSTPSAANTSSGSAFTGCSAVPTTNYTVSYKRTNFTCNYYQIDIPSHDDYVTLLINGTQVFQHNGCCDAHTNVWTGFLGASSNVEIRFTNYAGPGDLSVTIAPSAINPVTANTPSVVCSTSFIDLTASSIIPGATFNWAPDSNNSPSTITTAANNPSVRARPVASGNYIVTITDPVTSCTASFTVPITVANPANTTVSVSPSTTTTDCPSTTYTFTASGAASYFWSANTGSAGGLSATTGYQVTATPTQTTTYTVTGDTGCGQKDATVIITINVPATNTYPTNTWNVYGFNSQTIGTDYRGYYTENGSTTAPNDYSFNTRTRWADGASPATANATNGTAWVGCTMNATNISLSFKRSGFACGIYQLDVPAHDDDFLLFIDGVQVAQHVNGCCDSHTNIWTGPLNATSRVEWQLKQGVGGSYLQVQFTRATPSASQSTWMGDVSTDWFNAANWCGGVPTSSIDALIPNGARFMPAIGGAGAQVRNININTGSSGNAYSSAIAAASLTTSASNGLNVFGNWVNNGSYVSNSGTITFSGTTNTSITSGSAETFYNLVVNKTGGSTLALTFITQQISNNMTFTSGIVTPNNVLEFLNGATATSASDISYVQGQVRKIGTNAFTFPVGKGGFYRPIAIGAPSASDTYTAEYFNANPNPSYPRANKDGTLDHVGSTEYWMLTRLGTSITPVTLSWGSTSGGVNNIPNLRVAGWNSTTWKDLGNSSPTGTTTAGTITSASTVSTFGPFTLASANFTNPLPISLIDFTSVLNAGVVDLNWSTLSELNNDYFDIERSTDETPFSSLKKRIKGAGTSNQVNSYATKDYSPPLGKVYYRLKQVDFDGTTSYSEVRVITNDQLNTIIAYPNPADNVIHIDTNGRIVNSISILNSVGVNQQLPITTNESTITIDSSTLATGLYLVKVVLNGNASTLRVIVSR